MMMALLLKRISSIILLMIAVLSFANAYASADSTSHGDLSITHAVAAAPLPGSKVTAAYMTITNNGSEDDRLSGAAYSGAKRTEIHTMDVVNDIMRMRKLEDGLIIPAGQSVTLAQGGLHVMLMGLIDAPKDGDHIILTLEFDRAGAVDLKLPVQKIKRGHKKTHSHSDG